MTTGLSNLMLQYGTDRSRRVADDFYETLPEAVEALLALERLSGRVWEPSCGRGNISRVLEARGHIVVSTDLVDRGYGTGGVDFLTCEPPDGCVDIVTNPPYRLALKFARRALGTCPGKVALLLRLQFLEGKTRREFFRTSPPARVHVFSERLGMIKNGVVHRGGMVPYAWFVWDPDHHGPTELGWI